MASVNRVFIQGVLGHPPPPTQAHTSRKDGRRYVTLNIATTRRVDAGTNSRWETEWHQAVVYDHLAEYASEKLFKGNGVYVRGYLKTVKTTGRDGIDRYTVWVVVEEMQSNSTKTKESNDKDKQAPAPPQAQP